MRPQFRISVVHVLVIVWLLLFVCVGAVIEPPTDLTPPQNDDSPTDAQVAPVFPGAHWETRTPEEVGLDAALLHRFIGNISYRTTSHGVIIKDGYLVSSWGDPSSRFDWASAAKPVYSTLLLFALHEGLIASVDDPVRNWDWEMTAADHDLSLRQLANNVSGYARVEDPGEAWAYNDTAISLYARTLERVFDATLNTAAMQRLAPLQFEDGSLFSSRTGYGVFTSPRDFARIGWLWLNRGNWNGQQLIPDDYFSEYVRPQVPEDLPRSTEADVDYLGVGTIGGGSDGTPHGPGIYGFNWWFNTPVGTSQSRTWPNAPPDTFQAQGHTNLEVMTIIPSLNMVVAAKGDWGTFEPESANASMNRNLMLLVDAASEP